MHAAPIRSITRGPGGGRQDLCCSDVGGFPSPFPIADPIAPDLGLRPGHPPLGLTRAVARRPRGRHGGSLSRQISSLLSTAAGGRASLLSAAFRHSGSASSPAAS